MADSWWDEAGFLHVLSALNPARFGYMRRILTDALHLVPASLRVLDVGCGGGLLAEEFARLGCAVVGVDPSGKSLAAARKHAATEGLAIDYHAAVGEALPFPAASFDVVYCCDVLEHVTDLGRVIAESARVLRPGGTYFYDTINRTAGSRLIMIKLLQEWRWSKMMPARLHDWDMFIRPAELHRVLEKSGLIPVELTGLRPRAGLLRMLLALRRLKRGRTSYAAAVAEMDYGESSDMAVSYIGYAAKRDFAVGEWRSRSEAC
jgi:2-polyprenyl-6-hydroxyphenyl methylase/3-demethylubiquinone-9 3-methyltransferase